MSREQRERNRQRQLNLKLLEYTMTAVECALTGKTHTPADDIEFCEQIAPPRTCAAVCIAR